MVRTVHRQPRLRERAIPERRPLIRTTVRTPGVTSKETRVIANTIKSNVLSRDMDAVVVRIGGAA